LAKPLFFPDKWYPIKTKTETTGTVIAIGFNKPIDKKNRLRTEISLMILLSSDFRCRRSVIFVPFF